MKSIKLDLSGYTSDKCITKQLENWQLFTIFFVNFCCLKYDVDYYIPIYLQIRILT